MKIHSVEQSEILKRDINHEYERSQMRTFRKVERENVSEKKNRLFFHFPFSCFSLDSQLHHIVGSFSN